MPTRRKGESRATFMSRCISSEELKRSFPKRSQRVAVCASKAEGPSKAKRRKHRR